MSKINQNRSIVDDGVPRDVRKANIVAFNDDPEVRILVANDAAGEGVNPNRSVPELLSWGSDHETANLSRSPPTTWLRARPSFYLATHPQEYHFPGAFSQPTP
jgi:hypothetical protein